jgi:Protein of unknown function (DUF3014)
MVEIDDLRLNETVSPELSRPPRASGPSLLIPVLVIASLIGLMAAVYFWPHAGTPKGAATAASVHPESVTTSAKPVAEAGANIDLPPLDQSDALVRQLVSQLSTHPRIAAWLATDGLIRNFALVVATVAEGGTPTKPLASQRPAAPFAVRESAGGAVIDPASYHRYDAYADALAGLDARGAARLYATLKPRIAEAYRDLGYPDADIDAAVERAFIVLLRTPAAGDNVAVKRTSVNWQYADPELESLPRAQRQLLRMGPHNRTVVQDKLREIAPYLGIDPAHLPHQ